MLLAEVLLNLAEDGVAMSFFFKSLDLLLNLRGERVERILISITCTAELLRIETHLNAEVPGPRIERHDVKSDPLEDIE